MTHKFSQMIDKENVIELLNEGKVLFSRGRSGKHFEPPIVLKKTGDDEYTEWWGHGFAYCGKDKKSFLYLNNPCLRAQELKSRLKPHHFYIWESYDKKYMTEER